MRVPIHGVEGLALFRPDRWRPIETLSVAPIFQAIAEVSSMSSLVFIELDPQVATRKNAPPSSQARAAIAYHLGAI
jgi:hypothetical protein